MAVLVVVVAATAAAAYAAYADLLGWNALVARLRDTRDGWSSARLVAEERTGVGGMTVNAASQSAIAEEGREESGRTRARVSTMDSVGCVGEGGVQRAHWHSAEQREMKRASQGTLAAVPGIAPAACQAHANGSCPS